MRISMSSHAKLFVDLNAFGLSAYLASLCRDYHELQTAKRSEFFGARYYKMFCLCFFFSKMLAQKMTSHMYQERQKQGTRPPLGKQKSFNFFLINRFSLHEILIKMDCLTQGWVQWQICILEPLSAHPLFHLWNSTLWLLSTREYLWWRCPTLSHTGSVARQMLAFESEALRDWHVPLGWRGEQIILTNMHEIHPLSDNLFSRGNFEWVRQDMNILFFINASLQWVVLIWLTDNL